MIAKKIFDGDGSNIRFLSDFIIRSEQFCRVYNYVYDPDGIQGGIDPSTGLFIRIIDLPASEDLVTIEKWDLVDNSVSFYIAPQGRVYIEVATTPEEFGDTLVQPSVKIAQEAAILASASADAAVISAADAEAARVSAEDSETAAGVSETNAKASEDAAVPAAAEALVSENAAAISAAEALVSENAAAVSAATLQSMSLTDTTLTITLA